MNTILRDRASQTHLHAIPCEPTSAVIYRVPAATEDAVAMLANLEARGVAYAAPVDVQRQLWARGFAKLAHRIAIGGAR